MRKRQLQQILDLIQTLKEAVSAKLYDEAREGAAAAAGFINGISGAGTKTAALLEEYRALLCNGLDNDTSGKTLKKSLARIESAACNELKPDKIEIVFICYSASMSDSVMSIYLAAKADPDCSAVWLPVPYFGRNADRSIGKIHFDGADCYGKDVECADWRLYNIEERRPDAIVTCAPYDEYNYVTCIHPAFFCKRLRKLTDLLVYVPYFVTEDYVDESFCAVPGCIYANKVIVQSEKVRETYIRTFIRIFEKEYGGMSNMLSSAEDKFIALGSPKFEQAFNCKRENFSLPPEWLGLIGNRKTVLYNTSIASILSGNDKYLEKIRRVLDVFRRRFDVALWWRPHPLSKETYTSMRHDLLDEYNQIIIDYKKEGWGIYDDTADLHRAIACTDAYYGDRSSVAVLYEVTGKPVMTQQFCLTDFKLNEIPSFENLHFDGKYFWFSAFHYNSLFRMDSETFEINLMGVFPGEVYLCDRMYASAAECNGKLYFAPLSANAIAVYDLETNTFSTINLELLCGSSQPYNEIAKFHKVVKMKDRLYFIPYYYPGIICYDTKTCRLSCYSDWVKQIEGEREDKTIGYFVDYETDGEKLILPFASADCVLVYDTARDVSELYPMPHKDYPIKYVSACSDGKYFYFASADGGIIRREMKSKTEDAVTVNRPQARKSGIAFYPMKYSCGKLFIFPHTEGEVISIDVNSGDMNVLDEFRDETSVPGNGHLFYDVSVIGGIFYIMMGKSGHFFEFNPFDGCLREIKLSLSGKDSAAVKDLIAEEIPRWFEQRQDNNIIPETKTVNLIGMLECLSGGSLMPSVDKIERVCESIGENIYGFIKSSALQL